jgi:hypothetical protein
MRKEFWDFPPTRNTITAGPTPQRIVGVAAFAVLALILLRSPFGPLMLAVLVPANLWIAMSPFP